VWCAEITFNRSIPSKSRRLFVMSGIARDTAQAAMSASAVKISALPSAGVADLSVCDADLHAIRNYGELPKVRAEFGLALLASIVHEGTLVHFGHGHERNHWRAADE
jgi:hypothetical protein